MKKLLVLFVLAFTTNGFSQILDPVKWNTSVNEISDTEYELVATATIDDDWHLYSQYAKEEGQRTIFSFNVNDNYKKKGNTVEEKGTVGYDSTLDTTIKYFSKKANFNQGIIARNTDMFTVNAIVNYIVCDESKCIFPDPATLSFKIN